MAQWLTNPTGNHEVAGSIPSLTLWNLSCGVGRRPQILRCCGCGVGLWLQLQLDP